MRDAASFSALETLPDARSVEIRALKPGDRDEFLAAAGRVGPQTLQRRFFGAKRGFSEKEKAFFLDVDFDRHVAVIALLQEAGRKTIVGSGRYVVAQPGQAEVAFVVVDAYQGQGIGSMLLRHLAAIARAAGLRELIAEVLPENAPMLKVFARSGLPMETRRDSGLVHVALRLT
ncbi:MAG: GNAT family N-acetyltransferase [Alphaproteobacteria bacterium]|nr:MAG: GNAT family N-acetyltransferase [Alphaproteobacteria bacterium]